MPPLRPPLRSLILPASRPLLDRVPLSTSRPFSTCTASLLPPRRPKYPDTLPRNRDLYSRGYPLDSFDDETPPPVPRTAMATPKLPDPRRKIPVEESVDVTSMTDDSVSYTLTRHSTRGYSCSCFAWRMQKGKPANARTCKHLRAYLGDEYENARCGETKTTTSTAKASTLPTTKRRRTKAATDMSTLSTRDAAPFADPTTPAACARAPPISHPLGKHRSDSSSLLGTSNVENRSTKAPLAPPRGARKLSVTVRPQARNVARASLNVRDENERPVEKEDEADVLTDPETARGTQPAEEAVAQGEGGRELLLAHKFEFGGKVDPTGWWMSEKLDGVRAYWDGQGTLWSRNGKTYQAPASFLAHLPRGTTLDGELYLGRNRFDETSGIVRALRSPRWHELKYMVFDTPSWSNLPFETRLATLDRAYPIKSLEQVELELGPPADRGEAKDGASVDGGTSESPIAVVRHEQCKGLDHLLEKLKRVQALGGEGLMLRQPGSLYVGKRSRTLLKVKTFYDAEAKVVGYEPGKGKYEGMTGSILCQMQDGETVFSVGSGLADDRRRDPPPIGSIITYRFFELTRTGVPRFPTFVGERFDADGAKDAVVREGTNEAKAATPGTAKGKVEAEGREEWVEADLAVEKKKVSAQKRKKRNLGQNGQNGQASESASAA
ncbi:hypothetical protein JCM10212_004085 [Sporobolomyces blumeae]